MFEIHIVISVHLSSILFSPFTCSLNLGLANGYNNVNPQISAGNMGVTSISAQITSGRALVFVYFWSSVSSPSDITISSGAYVKLYDGKRNFGTPLTVEDKNSRDRILVGVNQNPDDKIKDDLQSVGWLMNNMNNLSDSTCIKFTDLHVVGSLSTSHVALLCMYNWYSVFGMKDCFVLFEDMSGTLDLSNFSEGSIISFGAYRHNLKLMNVNGQRVVVVQYYAS